ncbi:MAG: glucosidase [Phycisphaerales bacterium]
MPPRTDPESVRLHADAARLENWKRWGPYLADRQWGTVREDYSANGDCWNEVSHDAARSRAYRWGEDGLFGITDRQCRLCLAVALWNERDPILKERLFGLTNGEGNHGEDVKECYFHLDATPTHSYLKALYKYPQAEFPYARLVEENRRRGPYDREYELVDADVFDDDRYFDVFVEYAKDSPDDILLRVTIANRGPEAARIHVIPTLWFRNTWSWGRDDEGHGAKPRLRRAGPTSIDAEHPTLGAFRFEAEAPDGRPPELLFTDNETNNERLFGSPNTSRHVKDAFHAAIVEGRSDATNPDGVGTKAGAHYVLEVPAGATRVVHVRLVRADAAPARPFARASEVFDARIAEADRFYDGVLHAALTTEERSVARQAYAGLIWTKQFYHYAVEQWLDGDPAHPAPDSSRRGGRNAEWRHLYNRDVISVPDGWEYPWYAAWDLAFHMIPFARIDPSFAKEQLLLLLREWYMHPNGQMPAYEFAFSDVNPPVHAWACLEVYRAGKRQGDADRAFLARAFHKLLINFTWWVNRKDVDGKHVFAGGFLGLDNIGIFDRSRPLPTGGMLEQADGTAWMAFYCATMLAIALELASEDSSYEDVASKFFEHFIAIADAMNRLGGDGLWDERDGFYYDRLHVAGNHVPLKVRSIVGVIPLFAAIVLEDDVIRKLPGFAKRMRWFVEYRADLAEQIAYLELPPGAEHDAAHVHHLLAIPSRDRLERVLRAVLDEDEFLAPFGVRSVSRLHAERPYVLGVGDAEFRVDYVPGESTNGTFGGNSNWRGPIWFPINYLLVEALERYGHFWGDDFQVECPVGSGRMRTLTDVAHELRTRLVGLFLPDRRGHRPCHGGEERFARDAHWRGLVLFHEYFHGDDGRGLGASHQTGWTALVAPLIDATAKARARAAKDSFVLASPAPTEVGCGS